MLFLFQECGWWVRGLKDGSEEHELRLGLIGARMFCVPGQCGGCFPSRTSPENASEC